METDYPDNEIVEIFFTADHYHKLRVRRREEAFARILLKACGVDFAEAEDSSEWIEINTVTLMIIIKELVSKP